jgi:hypothetical protein
MATNPFDQFDAMPDEARSPVPAPAPSPAPAAPSAAALEPIRLASPGKRGAPNPFDQFDPAPITNTGTTAGFADEAPAEASRQLSPGDTAAFYKMLRGDGVPRATAAELRDFVASRGLSLANADEIVAARDKDGQIVGQISYPVAKPSDLSSAHGSALRGASQGATLGFGDELHGLAAGATAALTGGSFTDAYDRTVDADRGRLAADEEQHPYAALAGNVIGSLALPVIGEESGLTRGMSQVAESAYRTARLEGFTTGEARQIAQREVTWRLAKEGAAYGGAYGAGSADGDPGQRLLGATTGALEGAVGGAGLGVVGERVTPRLYDARVTARGMPIEPLPEATQVGQAAERQGISILPQDVGGRGIIRATQGAVQSPFGAKTIGDAADRLHDSFSGRVGELAGDAPAPIEAGNIVGARASAGATRAVAAADRTSRAVQDALAQPTDSTGAGQLIQRGVSRFMDDTTDRATELYNQVPIASDQPAQLSNTRRLLADLTASWQSNPQLGAAFRSSRLSRYLDALTPKDVVQPGEMLPGGGRTQPSVVKEGGNLSWQDLSEFRTRVGDMLADPNLTEKIAPRQLRALYGALTSDMEETAKNAGPQAFAKWKRANNFYDGRMKRINDTFSLVLGNRGDATPNEAFAAMQSMLKPGASGNAGAFMRIMRSMSPEDANAVRATIVSEARGGRIFDPDAFSKAWGQLSERGKSALLPQVGMRALMDDSAGRAALDTRNPLAGLSGEQIFSKLEAMAGSKGDAARFARTMNSLSPDEATAVRATFIDRLGRAAPGAQNAEGDVFSIARWLTRWNQMTPEAKSVLFGRGELRAAMSDLALLAEKVKRSEKLAGHSNTGAVMEWNKTNAALWTAVGSLVTGHPIVAIGLAAPAAYQRLSAEILTSPRLLRWLTRVPKQADFNGQLSYLSKLQTIAAREPGIAGQVLGLRQYLRDAISQSPGRAAAADDVDDRRKKPPEQ